MKKYIIKYANGSKCPDIKDKFNSREEAGDFLIQYIRIHNEFLHIGDNNYLLPFDFTLEEVDIKDVNEVITDFESAKSAIIRVSPTDFILSGNLKQFEDTARLVSEINSRHVKALIALNKLFSIAQAWNKEDDFVPNFSNRHQDKWTPWFDYDKNTARFMFRNTFNAPTNAYNFGSRLCFKTFARAKQFGKQFEDLYNMVFL